MPSGITPQLKLKILRWSRIPAGSLEWTPPPKRWFHSPSQPEQRWSTWKESKQPMAKSKLQTEYRKDVAEGCLQEFAQHVYAAACCFCVFHHDQFFISSDKQPKRIEPGMSFPHCTEHTRSLLAQMGIVNNQTPPLCLHRTWTFVRRSDHSRYVSQSQCAHLFSMFTCDGADKACLVADEKLQICSFAV